MAWWVESIDIEDLSKLIDVEEPQEAQMMQT